MVRSFFLANADVKAVSSTIKTIVKTQDMAVDERLGIIILRDTPEVIRMAERIVALQDLSDPEVMLEVEVMEIKRSRLLELGIQWPGQLSLSPLQIGSRPITLQDLKNLDASTTQATIGSMVINARKEDQDGNVLANPRIRVRNKEKAKVMIGDRVTGKAEWGLILSGGRIIGIHSLSQATPIKQGGFDMEDAGFQRKVRYNQWIFAHPANLAGGSDTSNTN